MVMKIRILGAHNIESKDTGCTCLLINDVLALDAGEITSRLSLKAQQKLQAVLLTHRHYDHVKDLPALGMNFYLTGKTLAIYTIQSVYEDLAHYLLDGTLYPDFTKRPADKPALKFTIVEPGQEISIGLYRILAVPVNHAVTCVGYQITSPEGKKLFYTSDTGPGLADCWPLVSPDMLITEVTVPNKYRDFAIEAGHLTPAQLQTELEGFRTVKGYLPRVITLHANPFYQDEIAAELAGVAAVLKINILLGHEGMRLDL